MEFTKEKAWNEAEKIGNPDYSDDYMWDVANRFGSYGEYAEWLDHQRGTEEESKRAEEFFQFHHLIE